MDGRRAGAAAASSSTRTCTCTGMGMCAHLDLVVDGLGLPPREHLDVARDLLARPVLARAQLDVARDQLVAPCAHTHTRQHCYRVPLLGLHCTTRFVAYLNTLS